MDDLDPVLLGLAVLVGMGVSFALFANRTKPNEDLKKESTLTKLPNQNFPVLIGKPSGNVILNPDPVNGAKPGAMQPINPPTYTPPVQPAPSQPAPSQPAPSGAVPLASNPDVGFISGGILTRTDSYTLPKTTSLSGMKYTPPTTVLRRL
jgi:hypothetical protein